MDAEAVNREIYALFTSRSRFKGVAALAIFAFGGAGVNYLNSIFTSETRWLFVLPVIAILLRRGHLLIGLRGGAGLIVFFFLAFSVVSTLWSDVPTLSGPKSIAYVIIAITFSATGTLWALSCPRGHELRLFLPLVGLVVIAASGGVTADSATVQQNEYVELYRGLTANSNFLGILALCAVPPSLWTFYRGHHNPLWRFFGYVLTPFLGFVLLSTVSRASIAAMIVMIICFLFGTGFKRYAVITMTGLLVAVILILLFPEAVARYERVYVYKGAVGEGSLILSREAAWDSSIAGAYAGGLFGLGFGVSEGFTEFEGGLSSSNYGREKGNTALAVIEELGAAGFILYLGLLALLFFRIYGGIRRARRPDDRVMLSIVFGALAGLVINSQFEAWFLAPGAFATPVFWTLFGLGLALVSRYELERRVAGEYRTMMSGAKIPPQFHDRSLGGKLRAAANAAPIRPTYAGKAQLL